MGTKVIVIIGPTCSGKTELGLSIAKKLNSEIISADSRQIYKYLNIGTAKPSESELNQTKHYLIDKLEPDEDYSASKFEKDAISTINDLSEKNILPIVVGGSGLYIQALVDGIFDSVDTDEEFRAEIMKQREKYGNQYLYKKLLKVDPKTASTLLPQNWKRIIRALEVFHLTGDPIWKHHAEYERNLDVEFLQFGLMWDREKLYDKIETRVDNMIDIGLVDEVKKVLGMGYDKKINALNTVGYKEIIDFIENKITLERAIELIKRNTRRYAKRQLTWFRRDERVFWFNVNSNNDLESVSQSIVDRFI